MTGVPDWVGNLSDQAAEHLIPPNSFDVWLGDYVDAGAGPHWHQDDLQEAYTAGFREAFSMLLSRFASAYQHVSEITGHAASGDSSADQQPPEALQDT